MIFLIYKLLYRKMDKNSDEEYLKKAHQNILTCLQEVFPDETDFSSLEILFNQDRSLSLAEINVGLVDFLVKAIKKNFIHENVYKNLQQQCQRLQATIRNHIKTEQQMRMFIEYLQEKDKKDFTDLKQLQQKQAKINELMLELQSFKTLNAQLQKNNLTLLNNNALLQMELKQKQQDIEILTNNINEAISNNNIGAKFSPRASCLYSLKEQLKFKHNQNFDEDPNNYNNQNKKYLQFNSKQRQKDDFLKPKLLRQTQAKGNAFTQSRAQQVSKPNKNTNNLGLYQSLARVQRTSSLTNNNNGYIFLNGDKSKQSLSFLQNKSKTKQSNSNHLTHIKKKSYQAVPIQLLHKRQFSIQQEVLHTDQNKVASNMVYKKRQTSQFGRNQISAYTTNEGQSINMNKAPKYFNNSYVIDKNFGNSRAFN